MNFNESGICSLITDSLGTTASTAVTYGMFALLLAAAYCLGALPVQKIADKRAISLFLLQIAKTALAVCLGGLFFGFQYAGAVSVNGALYGAGFFSMLGQMYPLFGDKTAATKGEAALLAFAVITAPICGLIAASAFFLMLLLSRYLSLSYVTGAVLFPVILNGYFSVCFGTGTTPGFVSLFCILAAVLTVAAYRENLARISQKTEPRFSFFRKG